MLDYGHHPLMATPQSTAGPRIVRFGLFEADLRTGELRKNGIRIRLQEQPFQVLAQLLSAPGEIVTRDTLRERIWPADTFVDFDHSLNTAINKIRDALGDSANSPRFIETVAKRGYRFIAPLQVDESTAVPKKSESTSETNPADLKQWAQGSHFHPELEVPLPKRAKTRGLFGLIQLMYTIFYLVALWKWERIDELARSILPGAAASAIVVGLWITALIGIPLRLYLLSAVAFDHQRLGENFRRLFRLILPLDQLWATAPLLLAPQIGTGLAFAATAALLYLPFSERTLIRLAYSSLASSRQAASTSA